MRKKKDWYWHGHGPPGIAEGDRAQSRPTRPWLVGKVPQSDRRLGGGSLFFRLALAFGLFALLGCGILAVLVTGGTLLFRRPVDWHPRNVLLAVGGLVLLLALAFRRAGRVAARRYTSPLSETMKAADALANGDLSARVPEEGSREFGRLARSFNQMAKALETADSQRRELLADIAHELRTPLTVIQGNLEGLRDGVYEATPEQLELVLEETHKLGRLVGDLRLLALAETGQLALDLQLLDVPQLLRDARDAFAHQAVEAGIKLTVQSPGVLPPLLADPQRMAQVLGNLLTNALRHTPTGGQVELGASLVPGGEAVKLWVADTGEGISPEDLPHVFDRFYRTDKSRARASGGAGLGLAIARQLVEAQGGWIAADGKPGVGATFTLALPVATT